MNLQVEVTYAAFRGNTTPTRLVAVSSNPEALNPKTFQEPQSQAWKTSPNPKPAKAKVKHTKSWGLSLRSWFLD